MHIFFSYLNECALLLFNQINFPYVYPGVKVGKPVTHMRSQQ